MGQHPPHHAWRQAWLVGNGKTDIPRDHRQHQRQSQSTEAIEFVQYLHHHIGRQSMARLPYIIDAVHGAPDAGHAHEHGSGNHKW
ncbi:hypothetical protein D3C71_1726350 [compost metagenome]